MTTDRPRADGRSTAEPVPVRATRDPAGPAQAGDQPDDRPSGPRAEEFVEQVLDLVEAVPAGCVTTYGDLAAMVGRGGPRQVGAALARHGAAVAWWRVVRADGRPADGLTERALQRLVAEGVPFRGARIDLAHARWRPAPAEFGPTVEPPV